MKVFPFPKRTRKFLPKNFKVTVWSKLKPYYTELLHRPIENVLELEQWLLDCNEIEAIIKDDFAWRYIRFSQNTLDERVAESYKYAIQELSPKIDVYQHLLAENLLKSPFLNELDTEKYASYLKQIKTKISFFKKENLSTLADLKVRSKEYSKIFSQIIIHLEGRDIPLQQANVLVSHPNRELRKAVFNKMADSVLKRRAKLDDLFDALLEERQLVAQRANCKNYRDYKFQEYSRRNYTVEDAESFHKSVVEVVLPIVESLDEFRMKKLGLKDLRPWDLNVNLIKPSTLPLAKTKEELIRQALICLNKIHPFFSKCMSKMNELGHWDLESRIGKSPEQFNIPLYFSGGAYIFMNAIGTIGDVPMIMNQSGYAIHGCLTANNNLIAPKASPPELTELAAMAIELFSRKYWDVFFENKISVAQAKLWQLEKILRTLPWIAAMDKFQHWVYVHPKHSRAEREMTWIKIHQEFSSKWMNYEGMDSYVARRWHWQIHLYESPFYYFGFGIAQLGAIALWKKYLKAADETVEKYIAALQLEHKLSVPQFYEKAGIKFDFTKANIQDLLNLVKKEFDLSIIEEEE